MEPIKRESFAKYAFLYVLTLGLYDVIFMYKMGKHVNAICYGDSKAMRSFVLAKIIKKLALALILAAGSVGGSIAIAVLAFPCIVYEKYWYYTLGERMKKRCPDYGFKISEGGYDFFLLSFLPLMGPFFIAGIMINNINRLADNSKKGYYADTVA